MVVRREVLTERLAGLREALRRLDVIRVRPSDDPAWEWAIERGLPGVVPEAYWNPGLINQSATARATATTTPTTTTTLRRPAR
jgi:hypothetical protein